MNTKEIKQMKIMEKGIVTFLLVLLALLCMVMVYNFYFGKSQVYATETNAEGEAITISNAEEIKIEDIFKQSEQEARREEYSIQETTLEYITTYRNNANLPKQEIQVVQEGREGKQQITVKKTYQGEALLSEEQVSRKITKASRNKIVEIGTGDFSRHYQVKIGDTLYVTSDRLSVMTEPDEKAYKVATLLEGNALKVIEIQDNWYKISCGSTIGYVKSENTTYQNSQINDATQNSSQKEESKARLMEKLNFDMALNQPSGLTLNQFKKVLSDNKDRFKILENNAEYFYYLEKQYNINGIFVAAIGIHESAWGTSKIAQDKKNLFGYGAYDSNPYHAAYSFSSYSESIDLIARVLVKYYINPEGTSIYGGEKAIGSYYYGATLTGVNTKYATDKNWANGVYQQMKYLYNKL